MKDYANDLFVSLIEMKKEIDNNTVTVKDALLQIEKMESHLKKMKILLKMKKVKDMVKEKELYKLQKDLDNEL